MGGLYDAATLRALCCYGENCNKNLLLLSYAAERWCCLLSAWLASLLWRSFGELAFLLTCLRVKASGS